MRRFRSLLLLAALACALPVAAQPQAAPVTAASRVDRTAMWIGDRAEFIVTILCRRQTDVLAEDLAGDKLKLEGPEVIGADTARTTLADGSVKYEVRYALSTYRTDLPLLRIAPLSVRYYVRRAGQAQEGSAPAGTVNVPGAVIAFRSVLPEGQPLASRDARSPAARPALFAHMSEIGAALVVLAMFPVAFGLMQLLAGATRVRQLFSRGPSRRHSRQQVRAELSSLAADTPVTVDERRAAFARLDATVRRHVSDSWQVPVEQLTAADAAALLDQRGNGMPASTAADVLRTCELALYGPPERVPSSEEWRDAVARAQDVLAAG
jgi:hypothetical protein